MPAGGVARTTMVGDGGDEGGGAWTSASSEDVPSLTGTWAGRMTISAEDGISEEDYGGGKEEMVKPDVFGIAIGASISALALGALLLWWFFWWRKHKREKEIGERAAWVRDLVAEVASEKGKVV